MMTQRNQQASDIKMRQQEQRKRSRRLIALGALLFFLLLLSIIFLILALTVFKARQPTTQILSVQLDGVAPRLSFPVADIQLNVTLILQVLLKNRNHASFRHGSGKGYLLYQGKQVGEADIFPGKIPAMKSTTFPCRLTLQVDDIVSEIRDLISDVMDGEFVLETRTMVPGRIGFLGFIKKHAVATSKCQYTIAVPAFKVRDQTCKTKTKL